MRILGIVGSPRKGGNTDTVVGQVLAGAEREGINTERLYLGDLQIQPCRVCYGCAETGTCVVDDDFQLVVERMKEAGGVVLDEGAHRPGRLQSGGDGDRGGWTGPIRQPMEGEAPRRHRRCWRLRSAGGTAAHGLGGGVVVQRPGHPGGGKSHRRWAFTRGRCRRGSQIDAEGS
ncbi:flavodoxin family protein [Candidatus Bipolaricaulota bacterium]|nr:flavodoxin family protein [Candidatus Bipolaricaulota bacterium]